MAQERGSKGPQKWLASILEPHPSGIPSSFCSWSTSNLWCISLGCFIFRLFWEDPWFQKRTSLVRTWIQPSNVTSSGSMGKSLGRRCGDSPEPLLAWLKNGVPMDPFLVKCGPDWLARLASRRLLVQAHGLVTMRIFPTHSQRPVLTMVPSTTSPQVWLKWGWVNAYPTVVGMNVHLPALGLLWYGQLQVPRIHGFIMVSYHFPIKITFWGICHYLQF